MIDRSASRRLVVSAFDPKLTLGRLPFPTRSAIYRGVELLVQIPLWLDGTATFDWLVAGRLAALAPTVDYRYWPPSALRLISFVALAASVALYAYYGFQAEWTLLVSLLALIVYGAAIMADIERQRGRRDDGATAPRYSEVDADY